MVSKHSGIEVIYSDECRRLLAEDVIGRVAVVIVDARVRVVAPVAFGASDFDCVRQLAPPWPA